MTNSELNARAASIMGWVPYEAWFLDPRNEIPIEQRVLIPKTDWNPAENIAQAFELAEKSGHLQLTQWGNWGSRIIPQNTNPIAHGYGDTAALAITRACVAAAEKATG